MLKRILKSRNVIVSALDFWIPLAAMEFLSAEATEASLCNMDSRGWRPMPAILKKRGMGHNLYD